MALLITTRFELVSAPSEFIQAVISGRKAYAGTLVNAIIPQDWPVNEEAAQGLAIHLQHLLRNENEIDWRIRLVVARHSRELVGSLSFKGPPDSTGVVELGWGVIERYRRQGVAFESGTSLLTWALADSKVNRVIATIPDENVASQALARRLGMKHTSKERRGTPIWEYRGVA